MMPIRYNRKDNRVVMRLAQNRAYLIQETRYSGNMERIGELFQHLAKMQWSDYLDIIVVAFIIYKAMPLLRSTGAMRVAWVVLVTLAVTWLANFLEMYTLSYLLGQLLAVGLIAIVVLYQPELRRMVDHISNVKWQRLFGQKKSGEEMDKIMYAPMADQFGAYWYRDDNADSQMWYNMIYCLQFQSTRKKVEQWEADPASHRQEIGRLYEKARKLAKLRYYYKKARVVLKRALG